MKDLFERSQSGLETTVRFRASQVAVPALWHLLTIALSVGGGLWLLTAYNHSLLGFFGIILLLWGALVKTTILLATYGFAFYAALFRREWFEHIAEKRHLDRISERVQGDLARGEMQRAEDRFHGLLKVYPDNMAIKRRLAQFMMSRGDLVGAGRVMAFHPKPTTEERAAIQAFVTYCGHDPFIILRRAVRGVSGLHLNAKSQRKIADLHAAIVRKSDQMSWLYRSVAAYLAYKSKHSGLRGFWFEHMAVLTELLVLSGLLGVCFVLDQAQVVVSDTVVLNITLITGSLVFAFVEIRKNEAARQNDDSRQTEFNNPVDHPTPLQKSYARQYIGLPKLGGFPELERDGFQLVNLAWEAISAPPPDPLPGLAVKRAVLVGDSIHLMAIRDEGQVPTSIWAKATQVPHLDIHTGRVIAADDLELQHLIGTKIVFHANHIASVVPKYDGTVH